MKTDINTGSAYLNKVWIKEILKLTGRIQTIWSRDWNEIETYLPCPLLMKLMYSSIWIANFTLNKKLQNVFISKL